jgi:hypothetical protein
MPHSVQNAERRPVSGEPFLTTMPPGNGRPFPGPHFNETARTTMSSPVREAGSEKVIG